MFVDCIPSFTTHFLIIFDRFLLVNCDPCFFATNTHLIPLMHVCHTTLPTRISHYASLAYATLHFPRVGHWHIVVPFMDTFFCHRCVLFLPRMCSFSLDAFPPHGRFFLLRTRSHAMDAFLFFGCIPFPWMCSSATDTFSCHVHVLPPQMCSFAMDAFFGCIPFPWTRSHATHTFFGHGYLLLPRTCSTATHAYICHTIFPPQISCHTPLDSPTSLFGGV